MQIMQRVAAEVVDNAHRAALNTASRTTKLVTQVTNLGSRPEKSVCRSQKSPTFSLCGGVPEWSNGAVSKTTEYYVSL